MLHHVAVEIREADAEACVAFWALLGFAEVEPPETIGRRARWVECEGRQVHLFIVDAPVVPPSAHVAVVADEYDATLQRLTDAGFTPEPREQHWGSPRAFVRDPAGHRVEVMAFPPM